MNMDSPWKKGFFSPFCLLYIDNTGKLYVNIFATVAKIPVSFSDWVIITALLSIKLGFLYWHIADAAILGSSWHYELFVAGSNNKKFFLDLTTGWLMKAHSLLKTNYITRPQEIKIGDYEISRSSASTC